MTTLRWLEEHAPGFNRLRPEERDALFHFLCAWSLFEAKALGRDGNANAIREFVRDREHHGLLLGMSLKEELEYFQNRYVHEGQFTYHFAHLRLRERDNQELVAKVLRNETKDLSEIMMALLIVAYRFRNNLFHGEKWLYKIEDQFRNFSFANKVLMKAVDISEKFP